MHTCADEHVPFLWRPLLQVALLRDAVVLDVSMKKLLAAQTHGCICRAIVTRSGQRSPIRYSRELFHRQAS